MRVLHAVEVLQPKQLVTAIAGYECFSFPVAARISSRARALSNSEKDTEEAHLDQDMRQPFPTTIWDAREHHASALCPYDCVTPQDSPRPRPFLARY